MSTASTSGEGEGFLRRWARRKTESRQGVEPPPEPAAGTASGHGLESAHPAAHAGAQTATPAHKHADAQGPAQVPMRAPAAADAAQSEAAEAARLPTMDDVARLTPASDFSAFVARGVDQAVRRSALKKLFADPHFQVLDRLDMYMDDYNKPSPMPDEMLAALKHSRSLLDGLAKDVEALAGDAPAPDAEQAVAAHPPQATAMTTTTTPTPPEQETP